MSTTTLPFHPFASVFPMMDGDEFKEFVADIEKTNGPIEPIVMYQGKILDGRNRYLACVQLKIEPRFVEFEGDDAAARAFVFSKNICRRHLKPADKRKAITELIKAMPEKSDRLIAKETDYSPTTIGTIRKEVEEQLSSTGQLSEEPKQKRVGADGKARRLPAKKARAGKSKAKRRNERARERRAEKRKQEAEAAAKAREIEKAEAKAKATQLAVDLIKANRDLAQRLFIFLQESLSFDLIDALRHQLEPEVATSGTTMVATMATDAFDNSNRAAIDDPVPASAIGSTSS